MRRAPLLLALGILSCLAGPASAAVPDKAHIAFGGAFGLHVPFESDRDLGFHAEGSVDYYITARLGIRATAAYARSGSDLPGNPDGSVAQLLLSGVYNWEMGALHPFAAAGFGFYRVDPVIGSSANRIGAHVGGGVEYFLTRRFTVVGEGRVHLLGSVHGQTSSFLGVNGGFRYYF